MTFFVRFFILDSSADYANAFKKFEETFSCCGISNQENDVCYQWGKNQVPYGCDCTPGVDDDCIKISDLNSNFACDVSEFTGIYEYGCYDSLTDVLGTVIRIIKGTYVVTGGLCFIAGIFSTWVCLFGG